MEWDIPEAQEKFYSVGAIFSSIRSSLWLGQASMGCCLLNSNHNVQFAQSQVLSIHEHLRRPMSRCVTRSHHFLYQELMTIGVSKDSRMLEIWLLQSSHEVIDG